MSDSPRRLVVGITGASGAQLGCRLLEVLSELSWESELVVSATGRTVFAHETGAGADALDDLATRSHRDDDFFAPIASGSYPTHGMAIVPCSMKTLAGIAAGFATTLVLRAADVCLKERRPLVLVPRESPLSLIHINNMHTVTAAGAVIVPPVLTLYTRPKSIAEVVDQITGTVLDSLGIENDVRQRWGEPESDCISTPV